MDNTIRTITGKVLREDTVEGPAGAITCRIVILEDLLLLTALGTRSDGTTEVISCHGHPLTDKNLRDVSEGWDAVIKSIRDMAALATAFKAALEA